MKIKYSHCVTDANAGGGKTGKTCARSLYEQRSRGMEERKGRRREQNECVCGYLPVTGRRGGVGGLSRFMVVLQYGLDPFPALPMFSG